MELSIVIPTFNRAAFLKKTLQSIVAQQDASGLYEVIVIDNGSTDDTLAVCNYFESQVNSFVYCYDEEPGQLTGRHRGTALSKGNIISFIDDDVELNPSWISSVLRLFSTNKSVSIAGGPCLPKFQVYPPSWVNYFWQPTPYGGKMCLPLSLIDIGCDELEIDPLYIFGLNYSIRKNTLLDLGGFHPDCIPAHLQKYQGDGETGLSLRAKQQNIKARYNSSLLLYHQVSKERLNPAYFEKWFYYNGVCQSFTDLRAMHKSVSLKADDGYKKTGLTQIISKARNVLTRVLKRNTGKLPEEIIGLQSGFNQQYMEGYNFHKRSFENDSSVRDWVLKDDYWNYKLPVTYIK